MSIPELIEEGVRAYTRGSVDEAERCWSAALARDPANSRARAYLDALVSRRADASRRPPRAPPAPPRPPPPAARAPVPLPPPRSPAATAGQDPSPWDDGPALGGSVQVGDGIGLDLSSVSEQSEVRALVPDSPGKVASAEAGSEIDAWMERAGQLFALGDFSGSLELIERILKVDPSHAEARLYLQQNEATLIAMYESKLGPRGAVPRVAIKPEEIMWLNLDHRAGFLLAQIDGTVSYEDLFALSGLPRLDTARILALLQQDGVIAS